MLFLERLFRLKKYIKNVSWMMVERVLSLFLGFFLSVFLARYLGPENYGVFSYALAIGVLFATGSHLGLNGIVIRDLTIAGSGAGEVLATTGFIKLIGALTSYVLFLIYLFVFEVKGSIEFWTLLGISGLIVLTPIDVLDYWFQSKVKYKSVMISRVVSMLLGSGLKIIFVLLGFSIVFVAFSHSLIVLCSSVLLLFYYLREAASEAYIYRISRSKVKKYFSEGLLAYFGTICSILYMKIDQVMIRWILGAEDVGIYSVAAQLSEAWYFIPVTILATMFPRLVELRKSDELGFNRIFQKTLDLLFICALLISLVITLTSSFIIDILFGSDYGESAIVLNIHVWAGLFVFMRAAFSKWIIIEKMYLFSILTHGVGAVFNVFFNFYWIPKYGIVGAAYATLISYAAASYLSLLLYERTRPVFWMMTRALVSPVLYPLSYLRKVKCFP